MSNDNRERENVTRRGVLKGTAAAAGTAATAGRAGAYRDVIDFDLRVPDVQDDGDGRTLVLLGTVGGWIGIGPDEIDGESNPTLRFAEGEQNRVVWLNGDGSRHNFVVADDGGDILDNTEFVEEVGEFTSLDVTPEEEMVQYYCVPHPVQMRGPVETVDASETHELRVQVDDEDGNPLEAEVAVGDRHAFSDVIGRPFPDPEEEAAERAVARFDMLEDGEYDVDVWAFQHERVTETVTIDGGDEELTVTLSPIETGEPAESFSLRLEEDQFVGQAPDAIADETNPTLEFQAGETYEVEVENAIGRRMDEGEMEPGEKLPGHNFVIATDGETNQWDTRVRSDFLAEEGETLTVEFVAREDMGVYLDQSQLEAMGEVVVE